jgi:hypothetical protein
MPTPRDGGHAGACLVAKIMFYRAIIAPCIRFTVLAISVLFYPPDAILHALDRPAERALDVLLTSAIVAVIAWHMIHDANQLWRMISGTRLYAASSPSRFVRTIEIVVLALAVALTWQAVAKASSTHNESTHHRLWFSVAGCSCSGQERYEMRKHSP